MEALAFHTRRLIFAIGVNVTGNNIFLACTLPMYTSKRNPPNKNDT